MFKVLFLLFAALLILVGLKVFFFAMHLAFTALLFVAVVTLSVGLGYAILRKA
jgi:hypothetical protein